MSLTIPKEQKHGVDVPAMMAFYQYVKLSPMGSNTEYVLKPNAYCDEIRWELSGDNIINLAKSYIQYDIELKTTGVSADAFAKVEGEKGKETVTKYATKEDKLYPHYVKGMKEGFGLASFRICNQTGTDLVKLDDSYEPYRIFMDELVRKRPDIFYQTNYYDGIQLEWDDNIHDCIIRDENKWEMPKADKDIAVAGEVGGVPNYKDTLTIHVKMHLGKYYNTFAALKSDVFFGERMYICIRFQTISNFGEITGWNEDPVIKDKVPVANTTGYIKGNKVDVKIKNLMFYAYYNKDTQCNNNTKSYCLSKPIQFNDFRCHQIVVPKDGNGIFNYSFTLNSSNGPFLRYIIYRPWIEKTNDENAADTGRYAKIPENAQFRWMINDFVYQPDYSLMQYYDSYMTVQDYFKDSWYDIFRRDKNFNEKFFEILNFGSKDLDNIKNQAGRPLASDLKLTFEFSTPGKNDFTKYAITHRFYIITGGMCTINGSGIVSVI